MRFTKVNFPIKKILAEAKEDYEKAWLESKSYLKLSGHLFDLKSMGKAHPLSIFMEEARKSMVALGFEELILPDFVEESEIYKQYGPEAALILDRLYYLAELPRPDIGVSQQKVDQIKAIVPNFENVKQLQNIFRRYKKCEIEADDLVEVMVEELKLQEHEATAIIDKVFPEFKSLTPAPTKMTLRSHTTALWFPVLAEQIKRKPLPLQYFLLGPKYRREQKQNATHLYVSNTMSIVIAAEEISLEDAQRIAGQICQAIGFKKVDTRIKTATSKYYAPQTEFEIFVQHPISQQWIEIGDGGFYSPVSLSKYDIDKPVLNIGFGCERITMIRTQETDIRRLVFPYFYQERNFTDQELAQYLYYKNVPITTEGKQLLDQLIKCALENKDKPSPIEILAWSGKIHNRPTKVFLYENEKGANLLGKAALNEIWIKDGQIISAKAGNNVVGGTRTNISYLVGLLNAAAAEAENLALMDKSLGSQKEELRVKMVKRPAEVNFDMDEIIRDFINSRNKKIDVKGPVFVSVRIEIE